MRIKKYLSIILAVILVVICAVPAFAFDEIYVQRQDVVPTRYIGIHSISVDIRVTGMKVMGVAEGSVQNGYTGRIKLSIQKSSNRTSWSTIKTETLTFENSDRGTLDIEKSVDTGYYYRTVATIYALSNGSVIETSSSYSNIVQL